MKIVLFIFGLITSLIGLIPFLTQRNLLPSFLNFFPTSGIAYSVIVLAIGVLEIIVAIRKS